MQTIKDFLGAENAFMVGMIRKIISDFARLSGFDAIYGLKP
jgi:hypothetical protein